MPEASNRTITEVKDRLEKALAALDKTLGEKISRLEVIKHIEKRKQELADLEERHEKSKSEEQVRVEKALESKEEEIHELVLELNERQKKLEGMEGQVKSLERENEILRKLLSEEKNNSDGLKLISREVSEQIDKIIGQVSSLIEDKEDENN